MHQDVVREVTMLSIRRKTLDRLKLTLAMAGLIILATIFPRRIDDD